MSICRITILQHIRNERRFPLNCIDIFTLETYNSDKLPRSDMEPGKVHSDLQTCLLGQPPEVGDVVQIRVKEFCNVFHDVSNTGLAIQILCVKEDMSIFIY